MTLEAVAQKLDDGLVHIRSELTNIQNKQDYTNGHIREEKEWRIGHQKDAEFRDKQMRYLFKLVGVMAAMMPLTIVEVREIVGALFSVFL